MNERDAVDINYGTPVTELSAAELRDLIIDAMIDAILEADEIKKRKEWEAQLDRAKQSHLLKG